MRARSCGPASAHTVCASALWCRSTAPSTAAMPTSAAAAGHGDGAALDATGAAAERGQAANAPSNGARRRRIQSRRWAASGTDCSMKPSSSTSSSCSPA